MDICLSRSRPRSITVFAVVSLVTAGFQSPWTDPPRYSVLWKSLCHVLDSSMLYGSSIWSESRVVGGYDASSTSSGDARVWKTSATGNGHAHENRPPYYALAFIMRVK